MFLEALSKEELETILGEQGKKVINYFIQKSIFSQPEKTSKDQSIALRIPKEHIEEWFIQALKVKHTGSGSYPVDFINNNDENNYGADIKCLTYQINSKGHLKNSDSGETSLGQNFSTAGNDLDNLFKSSNFEQIINNWIDLLTLKLEKPKNQHQIDVIYYFFILLPNDKSGNSTQKIYLCGTKVNTSDIQNFELDRGTNDSVFLKNVISPELGNSKIYKAKKRMELRLKPKKWVEENLVLTFDIELNPVPIFIRDIIEKEDVMELYLDYCFQKIVKKNPEKIKEILEQIKVIDLDLYSKLI